MKLTRACLDKAIALRVALGQTENQQSGRGNNPAGNFVRILHDDGTMGVYLHLMKGSVSVREGQRVETGSLLARSGNTGNSTGPHRHLAIRANGAARCPQPLLASLHATGAGLDPKTLPTSGCRY